MRGKYFIDTNIFVYSFSKQEEHKQHIAKKLISEALENSTGIISFQVIQEFLNVALRKFPIPFKIEDGEKYLNIVLEPLCEIFPNMDLYGHALRIMDRWQYSFYDSLIIAASIKGDCKILYSEDLQHQQNIENLVIINPFM